MDRWVLWALQGNGNEEPLETFKQENGQTVSMAGGRVCLGEEHSVKAATLTEMETVRAYLHGAHRRRRLAQSSRRQTSGHLAPSGTWCVCGGGYENPGGPLFFLAWVIVPYPDHGDTLVIEEDE